MRKQHNLRILDSDFEIIKANAEKVNLSVNLPYGNYIAKTSPLNLIEFLSAIGLAIVATFWWETIKLFKRKFS